MSREDELRENIERTAEEFKRFDNNPIAWSSWVVYLLKELESLSMDANPLHQDMYEDLLTLVQDIIRDRRRTGGW